jgi:hypothetical protein
MSDVVKRRSVDLLIDQFWKNGYLTVSRKFGTYLPEPQRMGGFEVDIIARYKKDYAIGITLNEADLEDPGLKERINFLATRQTKFTNKKVLLFVGIPLYLKKKFEHIISSFDEDTIKNIKIQPITPEVKTTSRNRRDRELVN